MEYTVATWSHQTVTPKNRMVKPVFQCVIFGDKSASKWLLFVFPYTRYSNVLRVRGGTNDPNSDKRFNEIPYLSNIRFEWDGLPTIDFQERVMNQLDNGLGSILQSGATLLATVNEVDPGGRLGNPLRAGAPQATIDESYLRNNKAFCCMLNYINPKSNVYKMFMRHFVGDAISCYRFITVFGPLATPQKIIQARDDTWTKMTMDALKLSYTIKGYFRWTEIVVEQGRLLGRNGNLQKAKLLSGFPKFFASTVNNMARDNGHLFPAVYGGMAEFAGSPLDAIPHPEAGRCNVIALARAYLADWVNSTSELSKGVPDGLVRMIDVFSLEEENTETANLLAKDVTPNTKCFLCGGEGHAASQKKEDGETVTCATKLLQSYKPGVSTSNSADKSTHYKRHVKQLETQVNELRFELQEAMRLKTTPARDQRRRSAPTAHELEEESDGLQSADALCKSSGETEEEDDASDESGGSYIPSFAEVAQPFKRRGKIPPKRVR
jgi:hypothetical protein